MRFKAAAAFRSILFAIFAVATCGALSARYLEQRQDHFDGSNTHTWLQAYYVNDSHWLPGSRAPVFLCVGGEGPPLDGSVVTFCCFVSFFSGGSTPCL
jgi:hypothetical protein